MICGSLKSEKLHDRLGSVRQVIDTTGNVKNCYTYQPFGELFATETTENVPNPFKFTGQYYDSEIAEYYLRARQYDPHIYRFTSRDPLPGKFEEPLTLHKYLYCGNDPLNRIDPLGLWDLPPWLLEFIGGFVGLIHKDFGKKWIIWFNSGIIAVNKEICCERRIYQRNEPLGNRFSVLHTWSNNVTSLLVTVYISSY